MILLISISTWILYQRNLSVKDTEANASRAEVWREGLLHQVDSASLVPGDVVQVKEGYRIPADLIIVESNGMMVNNAELTGESDEVLRSPGDSCENIFESRNVAFCGTLCARGEGTGVVFRTGKNTMKGSILSLEETNEEVPESSHTKTIENF